MTTNKPIKPLKGICRCGKKVTDHHFLCNSCWGISCKNKDIKKKNRLMVEYWRNKHNKILAKYEKLLKEKENETNTT